MNAALAWRLAGAASAWLTLLAPPLALAAWLAGRSAWPFALGSLLLAPFVFARIMAALRGNRTRARHRWMTAFGLGAVLMPLVAAGAVTRLALPPRTVGLVVLALWIGLALHAWRRASRVRDTRLTLPLPGLARAVRLVQLSDVHIGSRDEAFLERVVEQARGHVPELVVVTGDLLDESRIGRDQLAAFARFDCPVYLSIGNHERYVDLDAALAAIACHGVRVLRDEAVVHGPLRLIGIDDRDRPDALAEVLARIAPGSRPGVRHDADGVGDRAHASEPDTSEPDPAQGRRGDVGPVDVLLYHRPDGWPAARRHGIPLTLSGHTHGGQIWPFGLLVRRRYPELSGRFERDGTTLYVSSGTGTWGPALRLGTHSEMTVIDLVPDDASGPSRSRDRPLSAGRVPPRARRAAASCPPRR